MSAKDPAGKVSIVLAQKMVAEFGLSESEAIACAVALSQLALTTTESFVYPMMAGPVVVSGAFIAYDGLNAYVACSLAKADYTVAAKNTRPWSPTLSAYVTGKLRDLATKDDSSNFGRTTQGSC
jgi:hypothetical protein